MKRKFFQPAIPREEYTMRAIERQWPSGEWVEDQATALEPIGPAVEGVPVAANDGSGHAPSITIIGGTKYDEEALERYLDDQLADMTLVVGDGRGAESHALTYWNEPRFGPFEKVSPDTDRFGKLARKVNVEQVLCTSPDSPVLLVGKGERVKQAKSVLQRANWTREIIELP